MKVDEGNDDSSEEEQAPAAAAAALLSPPTPSKKAAARKRAALRKKGSKANLSASASEAETPTLPPMPSLPTSPPADVEQVAAKVNGAAKEVQREVQQVKEEVVNAVAPAAEAVKEQAALPKAPLVNESVSSSDAETQMQYSDDDDDASMTDEPSAPTPRARSPPPPVVVSAPPKEAYTGADHDPNKKLKAIITRTVWGLVMGAGAVSIVAMGHIYVIILVFVCQAVVFSELSSLFDAGYSSGHGGEEGADLALSPRDRERELRRKGRREERDRWSRRMSW